MEEHMNDTQQKNFLLYELGSLFGPVLRTYTWVENDHTASTEERDIADARFVRSSNVFLQNLYRICVEERPGRERPDIYERAQSVFEQLQHTLGTVGRYEDPYYEAQEQLLDIISLLPVTDTFATSQGLPWMFDLPQAFKTPSQQYLVYFSEFLRDLGVDTTPILREEQGKTLFEIVPSDQKLHLMWCKWHGISIFACPHFHHRRWPILN